MYQTVNKGNISISRVGFTRSGLVEMIEHVGAGEDGEDVVRVIGNDEKEDSGAA